MDEKSPSSPIKAVTDIDDGVPEIFVDPELEKSFVRKLDRNILPLIMIIQLVSFLDRSNIGNAKITTFAEDIHLEGVDFNVAASIFYVTYITFEIPFNVVQQRIGASRMIPLAIISWSLVTIFSGFIKSYAGLLVCRLMLGICEAGLFPGLNFYLSTLYSRDEYAKRVCMLFVATALSGAFGGLIAYGVIQMNGINGVAGWRWLFYIEGLISIVVGVFAVFFLPSKTDDAKFLTPAEKEVGRLRKMKAGEETEDNKVHWDEVRAALSSPLCWLSGFLQFGGDTCLYGFSTFLPTIIAGMGYAKLHVQYLTIPVYVWGATIYVLAVFSMDWFHYNKRSTYMLGFGVFTLAGYIILIASKTVGVKYFACFLCATGLYILTGLNITWIGCNTKGRYKRAVAIGMNQTLGNAGGVLAGQIYVATQAPRYLEGQAVSLAMFGVGMIGTVVILLVLRAKNAQKAKKRAAGVEDVPNGKFIGDDSVQFTYML